jgi:hypothetical protein
VCVVNMSKSSKAGMTGESQMWERKEGVRGWGRMRGPL